MQGYYMKPKCFRARLISDDSLIRSGKCGICGAQAIFDNWLDINICPVCGAHETTLGWQRSRRWQMRLVV
jgi:RNA polymerase subunit RPABC4/transcription elongation factor Spt4